MPNREKTPMDLLGLRSGKFKELPLRLALLVASQLAPGQSPLSKKMMWRALIGTGGEMRVNLNDLRAGLDDIATLRVPQVGAMEGALGRMRPGERFQGSMTGKRLGNTVGTDINLHNALGTFDADILRKQNGRFELTGRDTYDFHPYDGQKRHEDTEFEFTVPAPLRKFYERLMWKRDTSEPLAIPFLDSTLAVSEDPDGRGRAKLSMSDSVFARNTTPFNVDITGTDLPLHDNSWKNRSGLSTHMNHYGRLYGTAGAMAIGTAAAYLAIKKYRNRSKRTRAEEESDKELKNA